MLKNVFKKVFKNIYKRLLLRLRYSLLTTVVGKSVRSNGCSGALVL